MLPIEQNEVKIMDSLIEAAKEAQEKEYQK